MGGSGSTTAEATVLRRGQKLYKLESYMWDCLLLRHDYISMFRIA